VFCYVEVGDHTCGKQGPVPLPRFIPLPPSSPPCPVKRSHSSMCPFVVKVAFSPPSHRCCFLVLPPLLPCPNMPTFLLTHPVVPPPHLWTRGTLYFDTPSVALSYLLIFSVAPTTTRHATSSLPRSSTTTSPFRRTAARTLPAPL